ncbi:uncharacterized, partial [Tachysurus ichikawai]
DVAEGGGTPLQPCYKAHRKLSATLYHWLKFST